MFEVKYPKYIYDTRTSEAYLRLLASDFSTYKLSNNTSVITGYRDISEMTSGTYNCPAPSSVNLSASVSATSTNIECSINPLFINSGYKLILSNSFGNMKIFFANMDHTNKTFGAITNIANNNPFYIFNGSISDSVADRSYTFKFYASGDTAYFSFMNQYRYVIFTRLKPIDPNDDYRYLIIANSHVSETGELLFIDNGIPSANNCSYKARFVKSYAFNYNISTSADTIRLYNYVYDYKWYSEDIFNIYDMSFDTPTVINGELFFPIGGGLYLLVKG